MKSRWVLITGTSTGIGRATALRLAADGFNVIAAVRRQADADQLSAAAGKGQLMPVLMDVANADSIHAAYQQVQTLAGQEGLYALINNAGIVVPGPVDYLSAADWRRQFDVNFFGAIEVTRVMLPLLRLGVGAHGRGAPRILLVSSIGARVAQPILSPYTSSKAAMSSLGESLRMELLGQGIGVTIIEPGAIATAIWGKGAVSSSEFGPEHPARALYGKEIDGLTKLAARTAAGAISADKAADALVRALTARKAPGKVLVGRDAVLGATLKKWLPASWFEAILRRGFGIA